MNLDHEVTSRPTRPRLSWVTPDCEQITVSAEASAYAGIRTEWEE